MINKIFKNIIIAVASVFIKLYNKIKRAYNSRLVDESLKKLAYKGDGIRVCMPFQFNELPSISIGDNTTILSNSRISIYNQGGDVIDDHKKLYVSIGKNCYIGSYFSLLVAETIEIEDNVLIASHVMITSENHGINPESDIPYMDQPLNSCPVKIGEGTWIGEKAVILPGVIIGKKCVVGAASVVTKNIPDYSIAVGNPARVIKRYDFIKHGWFEIDE